MWWLTCWWQEIESRDATTTLTGSFLTAIVRRQVEGLYDWRDVHAIEVKAYWSVGREALYEAAAQAALHRCSFSWLLLYLPDESVPLQPEQRKAVQQVRELDLPAVQREAAEIGLGLAISPNLASSTHPEVMAVSGAKFWIQTNSRFFFAPRLNAL